MVTKNCFITTVDLKDAYCSVSISRLFQKFLKFKWKNKLYRFMFSKWSWVFSKKIHYIKYSEN